MWSVCPTSKAFRQAGGSADEQLARGLRIAPDVIVCARAGHTPLAGLAREVERLHQAGARVRGLVLWDDQRPDIGGGA